MSKKLSFLAILLLMISCRPIEPVTVQDIESVKAIEISPQVVKLEVGIRIHNPNNIRFTVKNTDLSVWLNSVSLGKALVKENIIIPPSSNQTHFIKVETNPAEFFLQALPLLNSITAHEPMSLKVKGKVKAKAYLVTKTLEVEIEKKIIVQ